MWREHYNRIEIDSLSAAECGALAVTAMKFAILNPMAEFGLFAAWRFGTFQTVGL